MLLYPTLPIILHTVQDEILNKRQPGLIPHPDAPVLTYKGDIGLRANMSYGKHVYHEPKDLQSCTYCAVGSHMLNMFNLHLSLDLQEIKLR